MTVLGRLQPQLSTETAQEPLLALANGLIEAGTTENGIAMVPLRDGIIGDARSLLWALQGAALLLMFVVAINAANLLLARSLERTGEFAVRAALGAGRDRIARQVLVETTLLALLSGVAGFGLALLGRGMVLSLIPDLAALAGPATLSWTVLAYTFGTAVGIGVLAGMWPATRATSHSWSAMKKIRVGWWGNEFVEIVGVVGDVKQRADQEAEIAAYLPQTQVGAPEATLVIRATREPYGLTSSAE